VEGDSAMRHLILKLDGVMQAWGGHTFEDYRPTELFPTRSGIVGLIAACLGIERTEIAQLQNLASSMILTMRSENRDVKSKCTRIIDYHTIQNARTVKSVLEASGKADTEGSTIVSRRQYLCDSIFTVAVGQGECARYDLDNIATAVKKPIFTPFLGRRACPLSRPLFETWIEADNGVEALRKYGGTSGIIYSEDVSVDGKPLRIRDVPLYGRVRQFGSRTIYVHAGG
jgi:CRISPR system Cascade subunit CasD